MTYPAKILLFGEYGILFQSMALAIPYARLAGEFKFPTSESKVSLRERESNSELKKLLSHLKSEPGHVPFLDLPRFESELQCGLYFDSTIGIGSGLGSSGALTAALYDRYLRESENHPDNVTLLSRLAAIETHFHGNSSGVDPLTSYLCTPLVIEQKPTKITPVDLSSFHKRYTLFLINTHSGSNTLDLVNDFKKRCLSPEFNRLIHHQYISLINQAIEAIMDHHWELFDRTIAEYSQFQAIHFQQAIPSNMRNHFDVGISSGDFYLKLCGSGGGGFLLAISSHMKKTENYFNLNHLDWKVVKPE